jgi:hypothetical protein
MYRMGTAAEDVIPRTAPNLAGQTHFSARFSADMRVVTDVATSPARGSRNKRADVRRLNARAAHGVGRGKSARIGIRYRMPRDYMARASHSGSCEHDSSDQCSRENFGFSHFVLHLTDPLLGLPDN